MTAIAKIFKNGQSQAVRLPKEFDVGTKEFSRIENLKFDNWV